MKKVGQGSRTDSNEVEEQSDILVKSYNRTLRG